MRRLDYMAAENGRRISVSQTHEGVRLIGRESNEPSTLVPLDTKFSDEESLAPSVEGMLLEMKPILSASPLCR
jgi:hypothetical protein